MLSIIVDEERSDYCSFGIERRRDEVRTLRWLKTKGTKVQNGEGLLEVETDKVNVENRSARGWFAR